MEDLMPPGSITRSMCQPFAVLSLLIWVIDLHWCTRYPHPCHFKRLPILRPQEYRVHRLCAKGRSWTAPASLFPMSAQSPRRPFFRRSFERLSPLRSTTNPQSPKSLRWRPLSPKNVTARHDPPFLRKDTRRGAPLFVSCSDPLLRYRDTPSLI